MNRRVIHSGKPIFSGFRWGALDRYAEFLPGTIVDVGAAIGDITAHLLHKSPTSNAVAFEPNPSNVAKLTSRFAARENVRVVPAAVSDKKGTATFSLGPPAVAEGTWTAAAGYYPGGALVGPGSSAATIQVSTTSLDDEITDPVSFLKIDVQGGELGVLNGAKRTFERGVELCYIEFSGEIDVLEFLFDRNFAIFDHHYGLTWNGPATPDLSNWGDMSDYTLSTGAPAKLAWPKLLPSDPREYCRMFEPERNPGLMMWTDIVAVPYPVAHARGWLS